MRLPHEIQEKNSDTFGLWPRQIASQRAYGRRFAGKPRPRQRLGQQHRHRRGAGVVAARPADVLGPHVFKDVGRRRPILQALGDFFADADAHRAAAGATLFGVGEVVLDTRPRQVVGQPSSPMRGRARRRRRVARRRRGRHEFGRRVAEEGRLIGVDALGTGAVQPAQQLLTLVPEVLGLPPLRVDRGDEFRVGSAEVGKLVGRGGMGRDRHALGLARRIASATGHVLR